MKIHKARNLVAGEVAPPPPPSHQQLVAMLQLAHRDAAALYGEGVARNLFKRFFEAGVMK